MERSSTHDTLINPADKKKEKKAQCVIYFLVGKKVNFLLGLTFAQ